MKSVGRASIRKGNKPVALSGTECILSRFRKQVKKSSSSVAVLCGDDHLTYGELDERANKLGVFLRQQSVGQECIVGICLERSLELVVALLGVLKAGCAYLPLDPGYPRDRLAFMLEDSRALVLITQRSLHSSFSSFRGKILLVENEISFAGDLSEPRPGDLVTPATLAYVLYTSGSTGVPKGVMIEHRSLSNFFFSMQNLLKLTCNDIFAATTSISFDISGLEIFLPLLVGSTVVMASGAVARDPEKLIQLVTERKVTVLQATPTAWKGLLDAGIRGSKLKVLCGGEQIHQELAKTLCSRFDEVWNLYGPTEATIWSSASQIDSSSGVHLGTPIANMGFYVLDEQLNILPTGAVGELYVTGIGLSRGYFGRPDLTAQRFVANPFGAPGDRMYRTGDLVRNGSKLEFVGRIDNQVKLRGHRIELEEIETALLKNPCIKFAAVALQEDEATEKSIIAYLVSHNGAELDLGKLQELLCRILPHYMLPSRYISLKEMPLTPNGKIDRKALDPALGSAMYHCNRVNPKTSIESTLEEIWKEVLKLDNVSIHENFFDLGGHSLPAMRITARVRDKFDVMASMALVFSHPTIALYASALQQELLLLE